MVKYICFQWYIVYGMLCSEMVLWNIWRLLCPFLIFSTHAYLVCFHRLNWIVLPEVLSYFSGAKLTYLPKPVRESVRIITSDHSLNGSWPHSPYNDSRQLEWSDAQTPPPCPGGSSSASSKNSSLPVYSVSSSFSSSAATTKAFPTFLSAPTLIQVGHVWNWWWLSS